MPDRLCRSTFIAVVLVLVVAAVPDSTVRAQRMADPYPRQVVSINPIGIAAGLYSGEYEVVIDRQMTVGATASFVDFGELDFTTFDGRWRIYPNRALQGLSFGLSGGVGRTRDEDDPGGASWGITLGSSVDYQWILGDESRFAFATGVGFKRFVSRESRDANGPRAWPTLRFAIGAAF